MSKSMLVHEMKQPGKSSRVHMYLTTCRYGGIALLCWCRASQRSKEAMCYLSQAGVETELWLRGGFQLQEPGEGGEKELETHPCPMASTDCLPQVPDHLHVFCTLSSLLRMLHFTYQCLQFPSSLSVSLPASSVY